MRTEFSKESLGSLNRRSNVSIPRIVVGRMSQSSPAEAFPSLRHQSSSSSQNTTPLKPKKEFAWMPKESEQASPSRPASRSSPPSRPTSQQCRKSESSSPNKNKLRVGMVGDAFDQAFSMSRSSLFETTSRFESDEMDSPFRHDRGLSSSIRRQNIMKEQFNMKLDASPEANRGGSSPQNEAATDATGGMETVENLIAQFREEVSVMDQQFEEMTKKIRLADLSKSLGVEDDDDREKSKREAEEAEKRRREAELRKARIKEKAARDPHRKIQLRLENKRRFEMDTLDKVGIPMTKIDTHGHKGKEEIKIVDVRALANSCQGLAEGLHSVKDLILAQKRFGKDRLMASTASRSLMKSSLISTSSSMPSLGLGGESLELADDSELVLAPSWEAREKVTRAVRKAIFCDKIVKRLNEMRGDVPERLPHNYDVLDYCSPDMRGAWETTSSGVRRPSELSSPEDNYRRRVSTGSMTALVGTRRKSMEVVKEVDPEVKKRVRKLWMTVRGVVNYLKVYFGHQRLLNSVNIIKLFVKQLGEWARIRSSIRVIGKRVTNLQKTCRDFLQTRRTRCDIMLKEFQRIEDTYLKGFFKLYTLRVIEEHELEKLQPHHRPAKRHHTVESSTQQKEVSQVHMSHSIHALRGEDLIQTPQGNKKIRFDLLHQQTNNIVESSGVDWKSLRIPPDVRKALIYRFYMVTLSKHVQARNNLLQSVQLTVRYQRDLMRFLTCFSGKNQPKAGAFGTETLPKMQFCHMPLPEFWHLSEELVIELIGLAAQTLKSRVSRFAEHPANKGKHLMDEEYTKYCRPPLHLPAEERNILTAELENRRVNKMDTVRASALQDTGGRRRSATRATMPPPVPVAKIAKEEQGEDHQVSTEPGTDLDQVWNGFTPRLRDIAQEQAAMWKLADSERDPFLEHLRPATHVSC